MALRYLLGMQTTSSIVSLKSLVSAFSGALCLLIASQSAFADCGQGSRQTAVADAYEGSQRGLRCEVVQVGVDTEAWEAQCDDPKDEAVKACDYFVDTTYGPGIDSEARYYAYEACMTIALHTPGAVR